MTQQDYTEIIIVLDRSGSMNKIKADMEGGFDAFLNEQKKVPGKCLVTLCQFNDEYKVAYARVDVNEVPPLTLEPRGNTALLGAIGRTIDDVGQRLDKIPEEERPGKVLMLIITDGEENHSRYEEWSNSYTRNKIMEMIRHQSDVYKWEFVYLGANQDAIAVGCGLGIHSSYNFSGDSAGTQDMMKNVSIGTTRYRNTGNYSY